MSNETSQNNNQNNMNENKGKTIADITTTEAPTWCPGCGDFSIAAAIKKAIIELGLKEEDTFISSGIGCGSKTPRYIKTYGFEGLHGRSIPVASAVKIVNPDLNVIAIAGDGDTYGIGGNHFIHSMRRNLDITLIVQNNAIYGLTKGQTSPTSQQGFVSNSTPSGVLEVPVNPIQLALIMGATYVARAYSYDMQNMTDLIAGAIKHKGFSLVDVMLPCLTFNKFNTKEWYDQRVQKLPSLPSDKFEAIKAAEIGEKINTGLFYKQDLPTYEKNTPAYLNTQMPQVKHNISNIDISPLLNRFR